MQAEIYLPWRDSGAQDRLRNMRHVKRELESYELGPVRLMDSEAKRPFSRAQARNDAVSNSTADVVVLCDADTLPMPDALASAIKGASESAVLHLPYTQYVGLTEKHAKAVTSNKTGVDDMEWLETADHSIGGVWVIQPKAWWNAEGMDPKFTGWGWEDNAFYFASNTLNGDTVRHTGNIYHLWHTRAPNLIHTPQYRLNKQRYNRYRYVARNGPAKLREFIRSGR